MDKIKWGIVSTGMIAHRFAAGLAVLDDAELYAVSSRTQEKADQFAAECGAAKSYDSLTALAADPEIDVIYIGNPHPMHCPSALECLEAGKAVLCEKPMGMNEGEVTRMIEMAGAHNCFFMEAVWSRFFPAIAKVRELVAEGAIGEVRTVQANFGFRADLNPEHRLFNPDLGGGALLDVGIYPIQLAQMLLGEPTSVLGMASMGETGVDEQNSMLLGYASGAQAVLSSAVRTDLCNEAIIYGTEGRIVIEEPFWNPSDLILFRGDDRATMHFDNPGNGYQYEAASVMDHLRAGALQNKFMNWDESLLLTRTMDALRRQWDLTYPMER